MLIFHSGKTKSFVKEDFAPQNNKCCFCDKPLETKVFNIQRDPDINLYRCSNCYAVTAMPMPSKQTIELLYADIIRREKELPSIYFGDPDRFGKHLANQVSELCMLRRPITMIDFGGGDGRLSLEVARSLRRLGASSIHIDVVDERGGLVHSGDDKIALSKLKSLPAPAGSGYDMVIAGAVIEHIPEPKETVSLLFDSMRENGFFYARTPYMLPFARFIRFFGIKFNFFYPAHLHDLGVDFWNKVPLSFERNDLRIVSSRPSIIEASRTRQPFGYLASLMFKLPWYLFPEKYFLVGGWEVILQKRAGEQ